MFEAEIRKIIEQYKSMLKEAGSEHQRNNAQSWAFNKILEVVEADNDK